MSSEPLTNSFAEGQNVFGELSGDFRYTCMISDKLFLNVKSKYSL